MSTQQNCTLIRNQLRKVQRLISQKKISEAWNAMLESEKMCEAGCDEQTKTQISEARQVLLGIIINELKEQK
ncbi:hypothetical protein SDC9_146044 [bioreactor metagenome]|uniref:Uncharacterized protein n=1 Tax=bioreactor metagenome TaxID=1076179 RepID=A0A645EA09_9ZZZZ